MKYCENCGHQLTNTSKFCPGCGQQVLIVGAIENPDAQASLDQSSSKLKEKKGQKQNIAAAGNTSLTKKIVSIAVVCLFLIFAFLKNPTKQDFMDNVGSEYTKKISKGFQENGLGSLFDSSLGSIMDVLKDPTVERTDFLIFSTYKFNKITAIGFCGNIIFTSPSDTGGMSDQSAKRGL